MRDSILTLKIKIATAIKCVKEEIKDYQNKIVLKSTDIEIEKICKQINEKGYAVIESYYSKDKCNDIIKEIDEIIKLYPNEIWLDDQYSDHRLFGIEKVSQKVREFSNDSFLHSVAEYYTKTRNVNNFTLGARLSATEGNQGSGGGWHRDSEYEKQFKSILYLTDVGEANGPFQYLPQTNNIKSVVNTVSYNKRKRFQEQNIENLTSDFKYKIETLVGAAGNLILVDTRGIHRGMPIKTGCRYALTNYFSGVHRQKEFQDYFKPLLKFSNQLV